MNVALPSEVVSGAITGAFVQLGYEKLTASQEEAILEFVLPACRFSSLRSFFLQPSLFA